MEVWRIIIFGIMSVITLACGAGALFALNFKGPIPYIFFSQEERQKASSNMVGKISIYKQLAATYGTYALICAYLAISSDFGVLFCCLL